MASKMDACIRSEAGIMGRALLAAGKNVQGPSGRAELGVLEVPPGSWLIELK